MEIITKNWKKINAHLLGKKIALLWNRWRNDFFIVCMFVSASFSIYIWYISTYESAWSEEKKQQYLKSQDEGIRLKTKEFENTKKMLEDRVSTNKMPVDPIKDIFAQ
mgnify:CR=1 FL=1